jgi:hypothetical protein
MAMNGDVAGAQRLLLDELAKSYGGAAAASANTFGGALARLRDRFSDLFLEMRGPVRDGLVDFINMVSAHLPQALAVTLAAFAGLKALVTQTVETITTAGVALYQFATRDTAGLRASLSTLEKMADPITAAKDAATKMYIEVSKNWADLQAKAQKASTWIPTFNKQIAASFDPIGDKLRRLEADARYNVDKIAGAMQGLKNATASAIGSMTASLILGQISFEKFVKALIARLITLQIQLMIIRSFGLGLGGLFGVGLVGGIGGGLGGFAEGGDPPVGQPSIVGEKGPELFVPRTAGTIIPNNKLAGGTTVHQTFNFAGMDFSSAEAARKIARAIAAQMRSGSIEALAIARASADQLGLQPRRAF